jgi:hypothetical protein
VCKTFHAADGSYSRCRAWTRYRQLELARRSI